MAVACKCRPVYSHHSAHGVCGNAAQHYKTEIVYIALGLIAEDVKLAQLLVDPSGGHTGQHHAKCHERRAESIV